MRSLLTYTAARLGLFAAAFGVVYLFGARSWVAIVLAWLISGLISYVLLSDMRDRISAATVEKMESRRGARVGDRLAAGAAREDHLQEAADVPAAGADPRAEPRGAQGRAEDSVEERPDQGTDESAPTAARES
ncbi:DUF4229 domain-containing protein [Nocardiopsis sp. ATB16-24]|uniref:DUF4229 domain-containing protein n=1 Tax=Nocardiopsis sp. ATB16-24 TaxID=3019555 RepID=UPI00255215C2|nr:DUF4229 domain-containing protein [Nocardiopsis sp. ATB16-24]